MWVVWCFFWVVYFSCGCFCYGAPVLSLRICWSSLSSLDFWCLLMVVDMVQCPFRGCDSCNSGGGKELTKKYFIDHLGSRHFASEACRVYLKEHHGSDSFLYSSLDTTLKKAGIWLCGECFHTRSFSKNCKHDNGIPCPLTSVRVPCVFDMALLLGSSSGFLNTSFDVDILGSVFLTPLQTVKSIPPKLRLGFARVFLQTLDMVIACPCDVFAWVQLLILPCCVLSTFLPKTRTEQYSRMRERCQVDHIFQCRF